MIIRRTQNTTPVDRPFPDENTVAEIYCNEAFTIDNEAVEDWTSSLQMLQTFAAIFSAVLITLIVDSKTLLEQDKTEVLVDAVVFLMNNLANGTHRPYNPPKFQPTTQSILVNCFFFASLCLSIATALAAVLAMQWVTDYGAVTRRAGSTPEERVKRRHLRYQGRQDWRMDTIIGALPIALHLSVLLFFVGLIVWMWDVHHSVFAVVIVCGAVAALFYVTTTILAIFYASCPYRTPLASWLYVLLHLLVKVVFPSPWSSTQQPDSGADVEKEQGVGAEHTSKLRQFGISLLSRLAPESLTSRDDHYIRSPGRSLMASSLVWLSNQLPISPDIYQRLLVFIDGFSSILDPEAHLPVVPWREIFRALGTTYTAFVETCGMEEEKFVEFARLTHRLSQSGIREVLESISSSSEGRVEVGNPDFPIHLLRAWSRSTVLHTSDALRSQRYSDEVVLQVIISDISSRSHVLLETWYGLLDDEAKTTERILPMILGRLAFGIEEQRRRRLDAILYLTSTGHLPWDSTVQFYGGTFSEKNLPPSALVRRLRAVNWINSLGSHPQKDIILRSLSDFKTTVSTKLLLDPNALTQEEEANLKQMGLCDLDSRTHTEKMLCEAFHAFDQLLYDAKGNEAWRDMMEWTWTIICRELEDFGISFDIKSLEKWRKDAIQGLSNPKEEWTPDFLNGKDSINDKEWNRICWVFFRRPSFFDGDQTPLWALRLRLWIHFDPTVTSNSYPGGFIRDIDLLKSVEQEIQSTQPGIDKGGDFLLALFHLNYAYGWNNVFPGYFTFIVDILTQGTTSMEAFPVPRECVECLSFICDEINTDPVRLVRLLIELIRADINHHPRIRRPQNLLTLLKHAEANFSGKELRPFAPSFRRLVRYIKASYQQFEATWDELINQDYSYDDPRPSYAAVDRGELKTVYERVTTFLEPSDACEGEVKDVSWPRSLVRPTRTEKRLFEEFEQEGAASNDEDDEDNEGDEDNDEENERNDNEEEHEDQTKLRLDDQPLGNSRSLQEGTPVVIGGPFE